MGLVTRITKVTTAAATTTTVAATTTNPDDRYIEVGRNLSHDGTDYEKAKSVYDWMTSNGSGTCVNYSYPMIRALCNFALRLMYNVVEFWKNPRYIEFCTFNS